MWFALIPLLSACVTTVRPPPVSANARPVFLLVSGNHANLVLTAQDGQLVRYSYGEWEWYAEDNTGLWRGIAALFWPTRATLGRRELSGAPADENVRRQIPWVIDAFHRIEVPGESVDTLKSELDGLFVAARPTLKYRADYDLELVTHPQPYSLFNHSNSMVAQWLRELGCEVRGAHLLTRWKVLAPADKELRAPGSVSSAERSRDLVAHAALAGPHFHK